MVKNLPANAGAAGDGGSIPGSGSPPGGRGAWWAMVHGVAKSQTRLSTLHGIRR